MTRSLLALYTKLREVECLRHVGREGRGDIARDNTSLSHETGVRPARTAVEE